MIYLILIFNTDKNVYLPPIDILKDGNETLKEKDNTNLYLIGGAGLIAVLILMKNK